MHLQRLSSMCTPRLHERCFAFHKLVSMTSQDLANHGKKAERQKAQTQDLFFSCITPALRALQKGSIAQEAVFKTKLWNPTEEAQIFAK
mmetsp:Transcript_97825/g.157753  ORF Transcript_97825/g.157753 Transcript_97825/m.157753 type:complete len:89 (-) Transcript_97825:127-393(-)